MPADFSSLPIEIVVHIIGFVRLIDYEDELPLYNLSLVNRKLYAIIGPIPLCKHDTATLNVATERKDRLLASAASPEGSSSKKPKDTTLSTRLTCTFCSRLRPFWHFSFKQYCYPPGGASERICLDCLFWRVEAGQRRRPPLAKWCFFEKIIICFHCHRFVRCAAHATHRDLRYVDMQDVIFEHDGCVQLWFQRYRRSRGAQWSESHELVMDPEHPRTFRVLDKGRAPSPVAKEKEPAVTGADNGFGWLFEWDAPPRRRGTHVVPERYDHHGKEPFVDVLRAKLDNMHMVKDLQGRWIGEWRMYSKRFEPKIMPDADRGAVDELLERWYSKEENAGWGETNWDVY
ncbi:hypothetical protein DFH27DRAFT_100511 [Peziza echinospora]|nr:hypothetical protein DFH27DRAFT_100511 [Peziza echinospora]